MHVTLWPSLTHNTGTHGEIDWTEFVELVKNPIVSGEKLSLQGWSPAKFTDNRRSRATCEYVSSIVLDDDKSGLSLDQVAEIWGNFAGVVHSSHSSTREAPKWRIVLLAARDMTPDEHTHVWAYVRNLAERMGQNVDEATKDPSRLWFVPARKADTTYVYEELTGAPLDVGAILADHTARFEASKDWALEAHASTLEKLANVDRMEATLDGRRQAMANALGSSWPPKGRHEAQLALAGALRSEGFTEDEALEFLCAVCRGAGDEDRPKRQATIAHTFAKPEGSALTSWTRLKTFVDPVVVDVVRNGISRSAEITEQFERKRAELAQPAPTKAPQPDDPEDLGFDYGCWETEPPPTDFLVDELIPRACVGMFFGRADALKTWLLFSLGLAVAKGKPWLGRFPVKKALKVGIVDFETGKANVDRRLFMLGAGKTKNLGRKSFAKLKPNDPKFWFALAKENFDLVIIDSLRRANPGANENESSEAIVPLERAAEFSELTHAAVLFIHHAKKDAADGWPEFRGSGAIEDQVDVSFAVKKTDVSAEQKTVEIRCEKPGDMRTPAPFVVEVTFNDLTRKAVLRHVEKAPPQKTEDKAEDNEAIAMRILRENPSGVRKTSLLSLLHGTKAIRDAVLAKFDVGGLTHEFKQGRTVFVMLNPSIDH